jgi:glycerophosphoryl diester phosphodiesterase
MFAGYLAFSLLLFFFPTILHKKLKHKVKSLQEAVNGVRILRIAHRGGARHITENTIEAFKKA